MNLKKIQNTDLKNKNVLLRVDFNVAIRDGKILEKFKIAAAKETISYILSQSGTKLALLTHWGRPSFTDATIFESARGDRKAATVIKKFSLKNFLKDAARITEVKLQYVSECIGSKVTAALAKLEPGQALLLENVRLYTGDEINDLGLSRQLAANFDFFVNDAFSVCHRDQASVTGLSAILPSFAGFRLQKEIENLDKVKNKPLHPAVAIIGGAKIETKLPLIRMFEKIYDKILVGGRIAIEAQNSNMAFSSKVILPVDYAPGKKDIGPGTISQFKEIIRDARTIVWNGPMGKFEEPPNNEGTIRILEVVLASKAFTVVGGGESVQILEENGMVDKVSFVSTGGGAMLEYLSGSDLPGIEALKA